MAVTARDLIVDAHRIGRIIMPNEVPSGEETSFALVQLNDIISQLRMDSLFPPGKRIVDFTVNTAKIIYTIGNTMADIPIDEDVVRIDTMQVLIGEVTWQPLRQISMQDYYSVGQTPSSMMVPSVFALNRKEPNSEIHLFNYPDRIYQMRLMMPSNIPIMDLDALLDMPEGYAGAIKYALASVLCPIFGIDGAFARDEWQKRRRMLESLHNRPATLGSEFGNVMYDIRSDRYVRT